MIGIFLGEQSAGKTLSMTYYAYIYYLNGYKIFCNYNLAFPHEKLSKKIIIEYLKNKTQLNKSVFLIDEIYLFLDSRSFGSKTNKLITYFLLQTSKRDVHLFGTAQYFNTVEKRFRENCNFKVYCSRVIYSLELKKYLDISTKNRIIDDKFLYIRMTFIIKRSIMGMLDFDDVKNKYLKASNIFKLYDTRELLDLDDD